MLGELDQCQDHERKRVNVAHWEHEETERMEIDCQSVTSSDWQSKDAALCLESSGALYVMQKMVFWMRRMLMKWQDVDVSWMVKIEVKWMDAGWEEDGIDAWMMVKR